MSQYVFDEDLRIYGGTSNLWMGPKLFWIVLEALPFNSSDEKIENRSYGSVVEVNRNNTSFPETTDFGVTFNERTYNDGITQNEWSLDFGTGGTNIITDTDFGFGAFDSEELSGGELSRINVSKDACWYVADLDAAIKVGKKKEGDILTTLLAPSAETSFTKLTIYTTESKTKWSNKSHYGGVFSPFLLTTFEDKLPILEDFEVRPNEERPFNPHFTWKCKESDVWYGFIIVDDKYIHNQYHKAFLHLPLNIPKKSNKTLTRLMKKTGLN